MRRLLPALALLTALCLFGCGGSSGGGGGGSSATKGGGAYNGPTVSGDADVFSFVLPDGDYLTGSGSTDESISKTATGLQIKVSNNDFAPADRLVDLPTTENDSVFKGQDGFILGRVTETTAVTDYLDPDLMETFNGDLTTTDEVYLGGKKLGLEYAEFGVWRAYALFKGTITNVPAEALPSGGLSITDEFTSLALGDPAKQANFQSVSGPLTFSGTALAGAFDSCDIDVVGQFLKGTADMTVDIGDLSNVDLALKFPGFYNFNFNGGIDAGGSFNSGNLTAVSANGTNNTGIVLPDTALLSGSASGQFYGNNAGNPTEGVGTFEILDTGDTSCIGINGAFGLTKQ